jgi:hypothetical protein
MHTGASVRLEAATPLEPAEVCSGERLCSRALSKARVSARLGYFKDCVVMLFSGGVTVLSAKHSAHKLGVQKPASAEPLLLTRRVLRT